jgi:hypothetical protein
MQFSIAVLHTATFTDSANRVTQLKASIPEHSTKFREFLLSPGKICLAFKHHKQVNIGVGEKFASSIPAYGYYREGTGKPDGQILVDRARDNAIDKGCSLIEYLKGIAMNSKVVSDLPQRGDLRLYCLFMHRIGGALLSRHCL